MKVSIPLLTTFVAILGASPMPKATAAQPKLETIEWCQLRWEQTNSKRPRVLLIGDSISVGYSGPVKQRLKGKMCVDLLATSKAIDNPAFLKETAYALEGYTHAVIHFNNGLHGWHVTNAEYKKDLAAYVKQLKKLAPQAKLIWASSTPVPSRRKGVKLDKKRNAVVLARNAIAANIMEANGIAINDLYALMVDDIENLSASKGNVHYNQKGRDMQGEAVANAVLAALKASRAAKSAKK